MIGVFKKHPHLSVTGQEYFLHRDHIGMAEIEATIVSTDFGQTTSFSRARGEFHLFQASKQ